MLLMAYMHNAEFFIPKMTRNYDVKAFRNDLKEVCAGGGGLREKGMWRGKEPDDGPI